jgi:PhoPQ-activated pathogenicity-related protein
MRSENKMKINPNQILMNRVAKFLCRKRVIKIIIIIIIIIITTIIIILRSQQSSLFSESMCLTEQAFLTYHSAKNFQTMQYVLSSTTFCIRVYRPGQRLTSFKLSCNYYYYYYYYYY